MTEERVERRLAAILAADVVGYSRLTGEDEDGTLSRLKALRRELIDLKIAEHRGRIVKTTGDGLLVEFPSVVGAVRCAVEVQRSIAERNVSVAAERRMDEDAEQQPVRVHRDVPLAPLQPLRAIPTAARRSPWSSHSGCR